MFKDIIIKSTKTISNFISYYILGIETSCDNTAVALIHKNKVIYKYNINQNNMLIEYGGYVPHILAKQHSYILEKIQKHIIDEIDKVDYIAVTNGPGIKLSLCIGYRFATFLSMKFNKKIFFVDHIEAHILSHRMSGYSKLQYLSVIVSGGHTMIVLVKKIGDYQLLAKTVDDSAGEVFDKIAKYLKIEPQNGAGIETYAIKGSLIEELGSTNINVRSNSYNLSFSGIKTRFINAINSKKYKVEDICYTLQFVIAKYLSKIIIKLINNFSLKDYDVVLCGGVANNNYIYNVICSYLQENSVYKVSSELACDNGEMIAWLCHEYLNFEINQNCSYLCLNNEVYSRFDYSKLC